MSKSQVSVIILAKDEIVNLKRTLPQVVDWARDVTIIDSGSSDGTQAYASSLGVRVVEHRYEYHSQQVNWALNTLKSEVGPWLLLLNADEIPDSLLKEKMALAAVQDSCPVNGYYLCVKVLFMNRWIRHGGFYPLWVMRFFRNGKAYCEDRRMDEKLIVEGEVGYLEGHVLDENLKGLSYWIEKHNAYSTREAEDFEHRRAGGLDSGVVPSWTGDYAQRKRQMKSLYDRLPLLYRARWYYWYRMYLRMGFLDGGEGRIWHYLQAYWYRYLVDLKITERQRASAPRD